MSKLILIVFCFLSFYSCKKVTKKNEIEYYSGFLIHHSWTFVFDSIPYHTIEYRDSGNSDFIIQHLSKRIGNKKDTIEITIPNIFWKNFTRTLYFVSSNSDSIYYSERNIPANEESTLTKYNSSKKTVFHSMISNDGGGYDYYFSGEQK